MQGISKNETCPKPLPSKLLCGGFLAQKWWLAALPTLLVLCHFELPFKKFGRMLLILMVQRETCELCSGGKCACCSLAFFLLSLSTPSLFTQIGFLECGVKKGRQPGALPWECVNSRSRGRNGPEALSVFHSLEKNEERNKIPGTIY